MEEKQSMTEYRKEFSKIGLIMLVITALFVGVQYGAIYAFHAISPKLYENGSLRLIVQMAPVYIVVMPFGIWLLGKMPNVKPEKHSVTMGKIFQMIPMAYALIIISNYIGMFITGIIGNIKGAPVNNQLLEITMGLSPLMSLAIVGIWGPIMEELVFRKALIGSLLRYGEGVAIVLSALGFAFFHGNLNQFVYAFSIGLFFGFIYVKTGNIKITMLLHIFVNTFSGVLATELIKLIDYAKLMEVADSGDQVALMSFAMEHMAGLLIYFAYFLLVITLVIVGIILFIIHRKKFVVCPGEVTIPKGQRFSTIVLNLGVGLYCVYWIYEIITQLLA